MLYTSPAVVVGYPDVSRMCTYCIAAAWSAYRGRDDSFRYRMRCWMLFWIFHPALRLISAGLCWLSGQYVAVQPSAIDFGREDAWESMTSVNSRQDRAEIMP